MKHFEGQIPPPFLQFCPLHFDLRSPKAPRLGLHISACQMFVQKSSLTYVCSSALNDQFPREKRYHSTSEKSWCPYQKNKKCHFCPIRTFFGKIVGAPPLLGWASVSLHEPHRSTQNYNRKWVFWKNVRLILSKTPMLVKIGWSLLWMTTWPSDVKVRSYLAKKSTIRIHFIKKVTHLLFTVNYDAILLLCTEPYVTILWRLRLGATLSQQVLSDSAFSCCVLGNCERHTDRPNR